MTSVSGRGKFITVEGGEGVGKSTQIENLRALLAERKIPVLLTREPGGTSLGEDLRAILLDPVSGPIHPDAELLMMFAARCQHVHTVIEPALASGCWVISDRFVDASYAYQGAGRGIEVARIEALQHWTLGGMQADLTLLLDVSPEVGLARAEKVRAKDRFEQESIGFFVRVRNAYLARAKAFPERYRVVDAGVAPDVVGERLRTSVFSFFGWI